MDFHQPRTVEQFQRTCGGNIHGIVQIEAQHLSFRFHHADHTVALAADAQITAERVLPGEQFLTHLGAQHHQRARLARIFIRQETARLHAACHHPGEIVPPPDYHGAAGLAVKAHLGIARHAGIDILDIRQMAQGLCIINGNRPD